MLPSGAAALTFTPTSESKLLWLGSDVIVAEIYLSRPSKHEQSLANIMSPIKLSAEQTKERFGVAKAIENFPSNLTPQEEKNVKVVLEYMEVRYDPFFSIIQSNSTPCDSDLTYALRSRTRRRTTKAPPPSRTSARRGTPSPRGAPSRRRTPQKSTQRRTATS